MNNRLRVLLLGGSGFIGKNIREQLSLKYNITAPTHQELNLLLKNDVEKYFKKTKPDVVIYAVNVGGTRIIPDTTETFTNNTQMFFNVVNFKKYFKKMIFLGSGAEYDKSIPVIKIKETDFGNFIPADYYGLYKYICSNYISTTDNIINLRLFGLFGKYEDYTIRFISNAINKHIYNLPITIHKNIFIDYVYVDDFIRIIDHFLTNKSKYKFYNIGSGKSVDLISLANLINVQDKNKLKIIVEKPGLDNEYTCDNSRLMNELKKISFTSIDESINKLYTYYRENKKQIKKEVLLKNW